MTAISTVQEVTPDQAADWILLSADEATRPIREGHVEFLAEQMRAGRWRVVGSTCVSFVGDIANDTARLVDGRQILYAIMRVGVPQRVFVSVGADEGAHLVVNTGRPGTFNELLRQLRKMPNVMVVGAAARMCHALSIGNAAEFTTGGSKARVTNESLLEFFDAHPGIVESTHMADSIFRHLPAKANKTALAAAHFHLGGIDPAACEEFFTLISAGDLPRMRAFYDQNSRLDPPWRSAQQLAALFKQWNAWRTGEALRWGTAKWIPTKEPWPVPV